MDSSNSLPANLHGENKPQMRLKSSASMSMEPHVSTTLHRARNINMSHLATSKETDLGRDIENNLPEAPETSYLTWLYSGLWTAKTRVLRQRLARLKWLLALYCAFSILFFSSHMFSKIFQETKPAGDVIQANAGTAQTSPLQMLPKDHLMSKLTNVYPPPISFEPFTFQALSSDHPVTACLWVTDDEVDSLPAWAARWKGAISLLVTTMHAPSSPAAASLLKKLRTLHGSSSVKYKVSMHVLYLAAQTLDNPNAFLNLARLVSQTNTVALFPGNLSAVPPKAFYRSIASVVDSTKPVVFTMRQRTTYPFTSLSPVLLLRDAPVWCTERFFAPTSRGTDWTECLWQFWLDNYGNVEVKPTSDWIQEIQPSLNTSSIEMKLHRRLSLKYRSETCVLAARQLAALRSVNRRTDAVRARWLKATCKEWTSGRDN